MPDLSGPELAGRFAKAQPALKVLCMSGFTDQGVMRLGLGADAPLVQKPFTPADLVRRVRAVLHPSR